MEKTIYLPSYAKNQLEACDDASVWSKPIPYREKPEKGFTSEVILSEGTLELGVDYILEKGNYHPDRDQNLDSTIESIEIVEIPGVKRESEDVPEEEYSPSEFTELTIDDFANHLFDERKPVYRSIPARSEAYHLMDDFDEDDDFDITGDFKPKNERVIEGTTFTDNFHQIGFTYHTLDGMLHVNYWDQDDEKNVSVLKELIGSAEDFDKLLKKADKKIREYNSKKFSE